MVNRARAVSPLDGRYGDRLQSLSDRFSEFALMRARCLVEAKWAVFLAERGPFAGSVSPAERVRLLQTAEAFDDASFARVKEIEATTRHDVKACEIFLRETSGIGNANVLHFGLTSEDVNNLAWSLLLESYRTDVQLPQLQGLIAALLARAEAWAGAAFPAHTHGQPASPTTAGKEIAVIAYRLGGRHSRLRAHRFSGKLNGATGCYSALAAAFPMLDWPALSRDFVLGLGLAWNPATTQIESHDSWAEYFDTTRHVNNIVIDADRDFWEYISRGLLAQKAAPGQVGSSTMPHKINPINFENSEGNAELANAILARLSDKLTCSRMQRDLSDSTVQRNLGVALGHSWLALDELERGLGRVELDRAACERMLASHAEVLAEPVQTILKISGVADPYEVLRKRSQGRSFTRADIAELAQELGVPGDIRARLLALDPLTYVGLAPQVCADVVARVRREVLS